MNELAYIYSIDCDHLYVHIPFCHSVCSYCDFAKYVCNEKMQTLYIDRLIQDLSLIKNKVSTIFVGGGTPSCLSIKNTIRLLSVLSRKLKPNGEFSIETNPEDLSLAKCNIFSLYKVNRVSIGVQSTSTSLLNKMGRKHSLEEVVKGITNLKKCGIVNINLDFIYGMKDENDSILINNLLFSLHQDVKHLSFYSLQIEKGTKFYFQKGAVKTDDELSDEYEYIVKFLTEKGIEHYEVSNFAKAGYRCKHNLTYWKDDTYYGVGLSSSGYNSIYRYKITPRLKDYLNRTNLIVEKEAVGVNDREFEYLMLNLRLVDGFLLSDFKKKFKKDFLSYYAKEISNLTDFLDIDYSRVRVKHDKIYVLDEILLELLKYSC